MSERATNTTPDPELFQPDARQPGGLDGSGVRGEVTACPTGLTDDQQAAVVRPGGGGAPGTGATAPASPGEGVTEEQVQESGLDK
jgi:hypothetical protein